MIRLWACLGLQLVALAPLLDGLTRISLNDDWTQLFAFNGFLRDQLLSGSLPVRADWLGGGFPIAGHPEYAVLAPHTLLVLLFGPVAGIKLWVVAAALLGTAGMYQLVRETLALSERAATWAAACVATLGWTATITASGNVPQITNLWWPGLLCLLARGSRPSLLLAAAGIGVALLDGHLNVVASVLLLGVAALPLGRRTAQRAVLAGALGAALAAYKLVPTLALLLLEDRTAQSLEVARAGLGDFFGVQGLADGFPLGPLPWLLALAGAVLARGRARAALVLVVVVTAALWLGWGAPLFARLPVLRSLDAPAKYFVAFGGLAVVALGAFAVERLPSWAAWVALVATSAPLLAGGWQTLAGLFPLEDTVTRQAGLAEPVLTTAFEHPWRGPPERKPDLYVLYRAGYHLVRWEDNFRLPTAIAPAWSLGDDGELRALAWPGPAHADGAQVGALEITPNRVSATVVSAAPTRLVVNQNGGDGWRCTPAHDPAAALLTVPVAAGTQTVRCDAVSRPLQLGAGISGVAALAALLALRRARRR